MPIETGKEVTISAQNFESYPSFEWPQVRPKATILEKAI